MEHDQVKESKKRTLKDIVAADLSIKLKSKEDFITYMDKQ